MTDFNLRLLVREVLDSSLLSDPGDLAVEVSRRIGGDDLRSALDQALRVVVREEITRRRMRHAMPEVTEPARPGPSLAPVIPPAPITPDVPSGRVDDAVQAQPSRLMAAVPPPAAADVPEPRVKPGRSVKVAQIRNAALTGRLNDRIHVGGKRWQRLGDCSFDDLMYAATERRDLAERTSAKAREFARLAEAVQAAGVARVRDLPAEKLARFLGGAAA